MVLPPPPPPGRLPPPSGKRPRGWMFWTWVVCWCGFIVVFVLRLLGVGS